jgi:Rad3-related DNA helicase
LSHLPKLIRRHFPFDTFNPGQEEAIQSVVEAFQAGKKHVVLQSPCGTGKSVIATTVHRVLRDLQPGFRTTIVTATKALQDQYQSEMADIVDLRAKTNYKCHLNVGPYNSAGCRKKLSEGKCKKEQSCDYVKQRTKWCNDAHLRLTNSSFQIEACPMLVMLPENKANLIVIDECHAIDEHLINHSTLKIQLAELTHLATVAGSEFISQFSTFINDYVDYPEGTAFVPNADQKKIAADLRAILENKMVQLQARLKKSSQGRDSIGGAIEELQQYSDKLGDHSSADGEWMLVKYAFSTEIELKPVYASQVSQRGLFRKADQFLHMSATICGFTEYAEQLGISLDEVEFIDVYNPIPVKSRRVVSMAVHKVSGDYNAQVLSDYVSRISEYHKGESGIIHTVSFKLANEIFDGISSKIRKKFLVSNDRREILNWLKVKGNVVLSPSLETGFDAKGDIARWQIIAKVPYGALGDPLIKLNLSRHPRSYQRKAVLRIVQASGRVCRGVTDFGVTYVLDSNFVILLEKNHDLFPSWFTDSIVKSS